MTLEKNSDVPALLMSYVKCPDCGHRGGNHPRRGEVGGCIGEHIVLITEEYKKCHCARNSVGRARERYVP